MFSNRPRRPGERAVFMPFHIDLNERNGLIARKNIINPDGRYVIRGQRVLKHRRVRRARPPIKKNNRSSLRYPQQSPLLRFDVRLQKSPVTKFEGLEVRRDDGMEWDADESEVPRTLQRAKLPAWQQAKAGDHILPRGDLHSLHPIMRSSIDEAAGAARKPCRLAASGSCRRG
jgi:hypothetical protein